MSRIQTPVRNKPIQDKKYQRNHCQNYDMITNLPKLTLQSRPNLKVTSSHQQQLNHKNSPLKKSFSVSQIIHGNPNSVAKHHYIDALQRFSRDHDTKNSQQRQLEKEKLMNKDIQRRCIQIKRQTTHKQRQESNLRRIVQNNAKILQDHRNGLIRNKTYNNSLGVNPINKRYEDNVYGQNQRQSDDDVKVNKLVRTHYLQTKGTSGYNLINGVATDYTQALLPHNKDFQRKYEQRLQNFYSKFTIKAQPVEEFSNSSKRFQYH